MVRQMWCGCSDVQLCTLVVQALVGKFTPILKLVRKETLNTHCMWASNWMSKTCALLCDWKGCHFHSAFHISLRCYPMGYAACDGCYACKQQQAVLIAMERCIPPLLVDLSYRSCVKRITIIAQSWVLLCYLVTMATYLLLIPHQISTSSKINHSSPELVKSAFAEEICGSFERILCAAEISLVT